MADPSSPLWSVVEQATAPSQLCKLASDSLDYSKINCRAPEKEKSVNKLNIDKDLTQKLTFVSLLVVPAFFGR